jgi:hypothetical protein
MVRNRLIFRNGIVSLLSLGKRLHALHARQEMPFKGIPKWLRAFGCVLPIALVPFAFRLGYVGAPLTKPVSCGSVGVSEHYVDVLTIQHCQDSSHRGRFVMTHKKKHDIAELLPRGGGSDAAVVSAARSQGIDESADRPVYRVRIFGNEIFYATLTATDSQAVVAEYTLTRRGEFYADIMMLHSSFSFCDIPGLNSQVFVAGHRWNNSQATQRQGDVDHPCGQSGAPFPECPRESLHGRWVVAQSPSAYRNDLLQQLQRTYAIAGDPCDILPEANKTRFAILPRVGDPMAALQRLLS